MIRFILTLAFAFGCVYVYENYNAVTADVKEARRRPEVRKQEHKARRALAESLERAADSVRSTGVN